MKIRKEILEVSEVKDLLTILKTYRTGIFHNKELPILTRANWLSFLEWEEMKDFKATFYFLKTHFADQEDSSNSFARKLLKLV